MNIEITKRRLIIAIIIVNFFCIIAFLTDGYIPTLWFGYYLYLAGASTGMAIFRISAIDYTPYSGRGVIALICITVCLFTVFNILIVLNR